MNKVLVISYHYPPHDCTASVEASKFTKFLPDHGWRPIVVSTNTGLPQTLPLEIVPSDVHRTKHIDVNRLPKLATGGIRAEIAGYETNTSSVRGRAISRLGYAYKQIFNFPDGMIGWYPYAVRRARQLVETHDFDVILSSAWPVTNHLVASRLANETGLPWVADFRDLWTENHWFRRKGAILPKIEKNLERRVLQPATMLTAPSKEWAEILERSFHKASEVIPNGFDPDDYPTNVQETDVVTLTYTGVFYPQKQDPRPLIAALRRLKDRRMISAGDFRLRLVGRYLEEFRPFLRAASLEDLATIAPSVPHREALRLQVESTGLLMLLWTQPEGRGWYSAKLYEYIGAGRPILAIGPTNGVAAQTIRRLGAGATSEDEGEITQILTDWIETFRSGKQLRAAVSEDVLEKLQWRSIVAKLSALLDMAARRPGRLKKETSLG